MVGPILVTRAAPMSPTVPALRLNDGRQIPQIGPGTWRIADDAAPAIVQAAIAAGCRAIDMAPRAGDPRLRVQTQVPDTVAPAPLPDYLRTK